MISSILTLYKKYKLKRILKNNKYIDISKSAIIKVGTHFDFRVPRNTVGVIIGDNSMISCNFIFESSEGFIKIGNRTYINNGTNLISRSSIEIGDDVTIAWGCYIYDHNSHSLDWRDRVEEKQKYSNHLCVEQFAMSKTWKNVKTSPIKICNKAWIGFNVVILKGVTIGEGAVIGACSVVTKDVPPYSIVAGNPAKVIRMLDKELD